MSASVSLRTLLLTHILKGVPKTLQTFNAKSGRFLADNGGWAVTQQDVIFPLALLYKTRAAGNRYYGDKRILKIVAQGGDALRAWQEPDGRVEFIKPDGTRWGKCYMNWSMYHWLETYVLLREELAPACRRRWETGLKLAYTGIAEQEDKRFRMHNIPAWNSMALVQAAEIFGRPHWREIGVRNCHTVANAQHAEGYWPEGHGPTTLYNLVYLHALGLYDAFTGDPAVRAAIDRATAFHRAFTYPDGTIVETVDGRVHYLVHSSPMGLPGLVRTAAGRGLARVILSGMRKESPGGNCAPHIASALQHLPDETYEPAPHTQARVHTVYPSRQQPRAIVRKQGPWYVVLSGYLTPPDKREANSRNRWYLDRQQYLSIWHEKAGLIVGGGNSKWQPERGTFIVWEANQCRWTADAAVLSTRGSTDRLDLAFGRTRVSVSVRILNTNRLEILFTGPKGAGTNKTAHATGLLSLQLRKDETVRTSDGGKQVIDPLRTWGCSRAEKGTKGARWLANQRFRLHLAPGADLQWPVYPFNPYGINNSAPPEEATAVVSVALGRQAKRFVIEVR